MKGFPVLLCLLYLAACERERREVRPPPAQGAQISQSVQLTPVHAGGGVQPLVSKMHYDENAYALSQGAQFYEQFNCVACHAHGGGDIGPALLDDKWVYGSDPRQIFASIVEGRPNGMPAYGQRLVEDQAWQLVAYVRSMSGLVPKSAAPGRDDHMKREQPANSSDPAAPRQTRDP